MKVLVIAAHPDDEVLGCAGTIARLVQEGHEVHTLLLGGGIAARFPDDDVVEDEVALLRSESIAVSKLLGVADVHHCSFPDNRFGSVPLLEIVKTIEELLQVLEPQVVYTQHGADLNLDHAVVFRATLTATRPLSSTSVRELYSYEVASSTEWAFQQFEPVFNPNVFVDITDTIDTKIKAMEIYTGEIRLSPHPRSPEALRAIALRWGSVIGVEFAEAFSLIRSLR